ncbi:MAG TPA: hypothetical protein VFA20_00940 [Myxococcaceae bacterium]|nr:hypothetical protein [Myxococcaceae bacterium]
MIVKPIPDPLPNEHVIQVEPVMAPLGVDADWRRRANLFTSRALSADALLVEQSERSGRLSLLGQHLSSGVVAGLDPRLEGAGTTTAVLHVSAGAGIGQSGEDVIVRRQFAVPVANLPFFGGDKDPDTFTLEALAALPLGPADGTLAGILALVPTTDIEEPTASPVDPCEVDTGDAPFVDSVRMEGAALVLFGWPLAWNMPNRLSRRWRSRLAYQLFDRERRRKPGHLFAWEARGVPLALLGFDDQKRPLWVDRSSVARQGGLPQARTRFVKERGSPILWQARILQFSEQLASLTPGSISDGSAVKSFRRLPPVGVLPKDAVDYREWTVRFFPPRFQIEAVPIPFEQLDAVARASASLEPLDLCRTELVRVLVPVPESVYEPRLLIDEPLDPVFIDTIEQGLQRLGINLKRRSVVRSRLNVLQDAISGARPDRYPASDPEADVDESRYVPAELPEGRDEDLYDTVNGVVPKAVALLQNRYAPAWEQPVDIVSVQIPHPPPTGDNLPDPRREFQGQLTGAPLAISRPDKAHVMGRGPFRTLWYRTFDGRSWSGLVQVQPFTTNPDTGLPLLPQIRAKSGPAASISGRGRLDLFFRDQQDNLRTCFVDTRAAKPAFTQPRTVAERCRTQPAAAWVVEGRTEVVYGGPPPPDPNGNVPKGRILWRVRVSNTGSSSPQAIPLPNTGLPNQRVIGDPVAVALKGVVHAFALITDRIRSGGLNIEYNHDIWQVSLLGDPSLPPQSQFHVPPGTAVRWLNACVTGSHIDLLALDGSATLWHSRYTDPSTLQPPPRSTPPQGLGPINAGGDGEVILIPPWGPWVAVGHDLSLVPAMSPSDDGSRLDVVARTVDGHLKRTSFDGTAWAPMESLGTELSQTSPAVIRRGNDVDVLSRGREGLLWRRPVENNTNRTYRSLGLLGVANDLAVRNGKVDEALDAAFLRVQTEIHRIRQLMLGNSTSSVLSTSPVLAQIAVAEVRPATQMDVATFIGGLKRTISYSTTTKADPGDLKSQLTKINPVIDTLQGAMTTKRDLMARTLGLLAGMDFDITGALLADVRPVPWRASRVPPTGIIGRAGIIPAPEIRTSVPLVDLLRLSVDDWNTVFTNYVAPKVPPRAQESTYFSTAIAQLEDLLNALRGVEDRVQDYQTVLVESATLLSELNGLLSSGNSRLTVLGKGIAEGRQDLVVARALLAEEEARLKVINDRRDRVRREHVKFLVYQRPRTSQMEKPPPTRALDTGLYVSELPAALAETRAAPPELWTLIHVLRDAPVSWFTNGPQVHLQLDRLDVVLASLNAARARALVHVAPPPPAINRAPTRAGDGVVRALGAQNLAIAKTRAATATLDVESLAMRGWAELQSLAHLHVTFGDLAAGGHGRPDVSQWAAQEVEKITKVATHLHVLFGQVSPRVRLDWAELVSEYDAPFDLRQLSALPRWNELQSAERRHLQELVDWLFGQMNLSVAEAKSLINDVVRTAILLASHAPVDEIVSGHLPKPHPAKVGGLMEVAVDPTRVRIGMHVLLSSGEHTVQAVVEDLAGGSARARVFSASAEVVSLAENTVAKFSEPSHPGSLLPIPRPAVPPPAPTVTALATRTLATKLR